MSDDEYQVLQEALVSQPDLGEIVKGNAEPSRVIEYPEPEVRKIREKTGLSQTRVALLIGVSKRRLENWEQGRRHPTGPAKATNCRVEVIIKRGYNAR